VKKQPLQSSTAPDCHILSTTASSRSHPARPILQAMAFIQGLVVNTCFYLTFIYALFLGTSPT
jgi:hypothetical protein